MAQDKTVTYSGTGFFGLLTIVLITLKLLHIISISWLWIVAIFFTPLAIVLLFLGGSMVLGLMVLCVIAAFEHFDSKPRKKR